MQAVRVVSFVIASLLLASLMPAGDVQAGKLAALKQQGKQWLAGAGLLVIACTTGCGSKMMLDKKYEPVVAGTAVASFAAQIPLGVLASQEKVSPAFAIGATGIYAASFILARSATFDYGEEGLHKESGGVDWYGMNNDLYSEDVIFGVRMDGQQQFDMRQSELEPYHYYYVLAHIHHNGHDYAAIIKEPRKFRRRAGPPRGLNIRYPSNRSLPKPAVTIVDSLQPYDFYRVPLNAIKGIYLTDHPDYKRDEWVVVAEENKRFYGKIMHHFSSRHAQVKIMAVAEDDNAFMLPEDEIIYRLYPHTRIQREAEMEASPVLASE